MKNPYRWASAHKRYAVSLLALVVALSAVGAAGAAARDGSHRSREHDGQDEHDSGGDLGPTAGLLARDHLTEESAIQIDLSHESVRLPLYKGRANGQTAWFVLLDASDAGNDAMRT